MEHDEPTKTENQETPPPEQSHDTTTAATADDHPIVSKSQTLNERYLKHKQEYDDIYGCDTQDYINSYATAMGLDSTLAKEFMTLDPAIAVGEVIRRGKELKDQFGEVLSQDVSILGSWQKTITELKSAKEKLATYNTPETDERPELLSNTYQDASMPKANNFTNMFAGR